MSEINLYHGNALTELQKMPDKSVHCCVTSPPYYGLRDYGVDGQIGMEETPEEFIANLVNVFREVKRVLRDDGTIWVNMGDSYAGSGKGSNPDGTPHASKLIAKQGTNFDGGVHIPRKAHKINLKPKDLIGIPWMLAFALRADGWYLRQDIIWSKPNPMPESVTDRCTKSHEYIFLLSKSKKYYWDAEAIKSETLNPEDDARRIMDRQDWDNKNTPDELRNGLRPRKVKKPSGCDSGEGSHGTIHRNGRDEKPEYVDALYPKANKRSVWTVTTKGYKEAHFATFPEDLIVDCIKAGCPEGGTVIDPFAGACTTLLVSHKLNRNSIGIELNEAYIEIGRKRLRDTLGMFTPQEMYQSS